MCKNDVAVDATHSQLDERRPRRHARLTWLEDECLTEFDIASITCWSDAVSSRCAGPYERADDERSLRADPVVRSKRQRRLDRRH